MKQSISVQACVAGNILQLKVGVSEALFLKAESVPGQTRLTSTHITLARLDDAGLTLAESIELPLPTFSLSVESDVFLVDSGSKRSCFVVVSPDQQEQLAAYSMQCLQQLGIAPITDTHRVFHVTLSNAGAGEPRSSIGAVWEFPKTLV
jgi:hypothetical protein